MTDSTAQPLPLFAPWIHGAEPGTASVDPPIQVQWFGARTVVLRQNMTVDFEAPFLYLFFGSERALLVDSGATADAALFPLRETIDLLLTTWLRLHPREGYELVVTHSHEHGDHIAGDAQFADRPNTVVVGADLQSVRDYFGFETDIDAVMTVDLGDRTLEVLPSPGHDVSSIAIYDPVTGWLLTGDTVYPGRLYVRDATAWIDSIARLDDFAASRNVTAVMGGHIEMSTTPGVDYPAGTKWQPAEPPLPMAPALLTELRAVSEAARQRGRHVFDAFIIVSFNDSGTSYFTAAWIVVPVRPLAHCYQITHHDHTNRDEDGRYRGPSGEDSDHGVVEAAYLAAVSAFAADAGVTSLSIREPGIWNLWDIGAQPTADGDALEGLFPTGRDGFHDGAVVTVEVGLELVRAMLRDAGAWCRLEADELFWIHVDDDQHLYVSSSQPLDDAVAVARDLGLFVEAIRASPLIVNQEEPPAPSADQAFWADVAGLIAESGTLLLKERPVSGFSRWHRITLDNLDSVRQSLAPRSLVFVWPNLSTDVAAELSRLQDDLAAVVVWEDRTGVIAEEHVDLESIFVMSSRLATARGATITLFDDDSHPLLVGVLPDPDGVVRARWTP